MLANPAATACFAISARAPLLAVSVTLAVLHGALPTELPAQLATPLPPIPGLPLGPEALAVSAVGIVAYTPTGLTILDRRQRPLSWRLSAPRAALGRPVDTRDGLTRPLREKGVFLRPEGPLILTTAGDDDEPCTGDERLVLIEDPFGTPRWRELGPADAAVGTPEAPFVEVGPGVALAGSSRSGLHRLSLSGGTWRYERFSWPAIVNGDFQPIHGIHALSDGSVALLGVHTLTQGTERVELLLADPFATTPSFSLLPRPSGFDNSQPLAQAHVTDAGVLVHSFFDAIAREYRTHFELRRVGAAPLRGLFGSQGSGQGVGAGPRAFPFEGVAAWPGNLMTVHTRNGGRQQETSIALYLMPDAVANPSVARVGSECSSTVWFVAPAGPRVVVSSNAMATDFVGVAGADLRSGTRRFFRSDQRGIPGFRLPLRLGAAGLMTFKRLGSGREVATEALFFADPFHAQSPRSFGASAGAPREALALGEGAALLATRSPGPSGFFHAGPTQLTLLELGVSGLARGAGPGAVREGVSLDTQPPLPSFGAPFQVEAAVPQGSTAWPEALLAVSSSAAREPTLLASPTPTGDPGALFVDPADPQATFFVAPVQGGRARWSFPAIGLRPELFGLRSRLQAMVYDGLGGFDLSAERVLVLDP